MKVKNEYVVIKNGKKQIKVHNLILNNFLSQIIANQFDVIERKNLNMYYIFIKFDTNLSFDEASQLTKNDFDLAVYCCFYNTEMTKTDIINNYTYKIEKGYYATEIATNEEINNFENYNQRKITAIGFGNNTYDNLYACLDVSNYNIYFDSSQIFSITRKDVLSTDGYFYSQDDIVQAPIHLGDGIGISNPRTGLYKDYYGILKSIGLGINPFKMLEEHDLRPYAQHIETGINNINILDELTIEYIDEGLFPASNTYPASNIYPARIINEVLYPSNEIYPRHRCLPNIYTLSICAIKI